MFYLIGKKKCSINSLFTREVSAGYFAPVSFECRGFGGKKKNMKQTPISLKYGISIPRAIEISAALSKIKLNGLTASQMTEEIIEKLGITEENEIKAIEELVNDSILLKRN